MAANLFLLSSFPSVAVFWLFSGYYFMITTVDAKLLMVDFEGVKTLESALRVWTEDEIISLCSLLAHYRTRGSIESM